MAWRTEEDLITALVCDMTWAEPLVGTHNALVLREAKGLFGIPDLIVGAPSDGESGCVCFAFEAKLCNWKRALAQAYKYLSFSSASYVVMDASKARSAIAQAELFRQAGIGLLSFSSEGEVCCVVPAVVSRPSSDALSSKAKQSLEDLSFYD